MITMTGKHVDTDRIRHAYARGQETITREEGETIAAFVTRACQVYGPDAVVKLTNTTGGVVARTAAGSMLLVA